MDTSSCIMDQEISSESAKLAPPRRAPEQQCLQRAGSGASAVLDPPEAGGGVCADAESRKLPSSRFKGVVPQPNGRWGAQIYEKHQRVWLGTFNDEPEAARAYDAAAQRFRGRDAVTNFKPLSDSNEEDAPELAFLSSHSKAEIVDMLRKHTYDDELRQIKRAHGAGSNNLLRRAPAMAPGIAAGARQQLFEKAVTPSDVGKLNRLVIPKQHAEKHLPLHGGGSGCGGGAGGKGVLLNFEDAGGKVWRFRYSYWNSSQSYVLTKGWSRFVKEKSLKAGDVVSFQRSTGPEKQLFIDWKPRAVLQSAPRTVVRPVQVFRLFGVNISKAPDSMSGIDAWINGTNKRERDMDQLLPPPPQFLIKKQCVRPCLMEF